MIINLDDSLLVKAENNDFSQDEIRCFNSICTSRVRGFHFVLGSRKLLTLLSKSSCFCGDTQSIFRIIYNDQTRWYHLLNDFSFSINIISDLIDPFSIESEGKIKFCVSLSYFLDYSLDLKPNIISENLIDAKFYEAMVKSYLCFKNVTGIALVYKNVLGGGSTTHDVINEIYSSLDGISFSILDRDNTSPYVDIGETAKKVINNIPDNNLARYHIMGYRELENLIPSKILSDIFKNNRAQLIKLDFYKKIRTLIINGESPIKYIDFKKGIKLNVIDCLGSNSTKQYWNSVFNCIIDDICCDKRDRCESYKKCTKTIVDGFGSDLLKAAVTHIKNNGFNYSNIDEDMQIEWDVICNKISPYMISPLKKSA